MNTIKSIVIFSAFIAAAGAICISNAAQFKSSNQNVLKNEPLQTMEICSPQGTSAGSWFNTISQSIKTSTSLWLQLVLVLFLGLLMSLTPCIYPMIPITVGILQAQAGTSLAYNFLLALSYTMGIATTFASLGFFAAYSGQMFGAVLANPYVVIPVALLLAYLGGSMLGLYEMYVPRWMQASTNQTVKQGSLLSTFLFGVASGTVASPCLSPGLVFLLSIVTVMANKLLGFLMLFTFGIGLSIPLLFIGSFSSSINLLPRAGMWMVEIKRLFGIMLIAMCFYFLANIMPWTILFMCASITSLVLGLFYFYITTSNDHMLWIIIKSSIGIGLIILAVVLGTYAYTSKHRASFTSQANCWLTNYQDAVQIANKNNKYVFVDIGAPCCSLCHAIDAKFFTDPYVLDALQEHCILLKIDGSATDNASTISILNQYNVIGFPTLLLINPTSNTVVKQWGGEVYDIGKPDLIAELHSFKKSSD